MTSVYSVNSDWITIPVASQAAGVNLSGIVAIFRDNAITCHPEEADKVKQALRDAGFDKRSGLDTWVKTSEIAESLDEPAIVSTAVAGDSIIEGELADMAEEAIRAAKITVEIKSPPVKPVERYAQLSEIENLETKAFNLIEHKEKIFSRLNDDSERGFEDMLSSGLDRKVGSLRDNIVGARQSLNSKFQDFVNIATQAKATEYLNKEVEKLVKNLENPNDEWKTKLKEISDRLKSLGGYIQSETLGDTIITKIKAVLNSSVSMRSSEAAMREVSIAETALNANIEALKVVALTKNTISQTARQQLGDIAGLAFVEEIQFHGGSLVITTSPAKLMYMWGIYSDKDCAKNQRELEIGKFKIYLSMQRDVGGIELENLKYGNNGYHQHPHISGKANAGRGQSICWGSISQSVMKLLRDWDFLTLVQLIWSYLNSYNPFDSYVKLERLWKNWTGEDLPSPERIKR